MDCVVFMHHNVAVTIVIRVWIAYVVKMNIVLCKYDKIVRQRREKNVQIKMEYSNNFQQ